jgi:hypothetical protein
VLFRPSVVFAKYRSSRLFFVHALAMQALLPYRRCLEGKSQPWQCAQKFMAMTLPLSALRS